MVRWDPGAVGVPPESAVLHYYIHQPDGTILEDYLELRTVSKAQGLYGSRTYGAASPAANYTRCASLRMGAAWSYRPGPPSTWAPPPSRGSGPSTSGRRTRRQRDSGGIRINPGLFDSFQTGRGLFDISRLAPGGKMWYTGGDFRKGGVSWRNGRA